MPRSREVYLLDPQVHTPETIAVAFAKTSRSPDSFRKIASELTGESSAEFNEKWVVGYGHSSVAEHAVLHIAVENVSRLAVECLESNRLASYTEKSTRYQKWNSDDFHIPEEFSDVTSKMVYIETCQLLFKLYEDSLPAIIESLTRDYVDVPGESPARKERIILTAAGDVCRFLLPVSAFANVGMTINARALEHAVTKMLSHPLLEVQSMGREIKAISQKNIPTLLKYANEQPSLKETAEFFASNLPNEKSIADKVYKPGARLVDYDTQLETKILQAAIVRYSGVTYTQAGEILSRWDPQTWKSFLNSVTGNLKDHEIPIRELEYGNLLFEITLDEGAYLELKRHRMMTLTPAPFSTRYGFSIPRQFQKANWLDSYRLAMDRVNDAYDKLSTVSPAAASYVLPNAFNRLVLMQTNFRSLSHFIGLRSAPNAHFSMRRIAQQMADQTMNQFPTLGSFLKVNKAETADGIENQFFYRV